MLNHSYSFTDCLDNAIKSAWSVDDCFQGRHFDFSKRLLHDADREVKRAKNPFN